MDSQQFANSVELALIVIIILFFFVGVIMFLVGWDMTRFQNPSTAEEGKKVKSWGANILIGVIAILAVCTCPWWLSAFVLIM